MRQLTIVPEAKRSGMYEWMGQGLGARAQGEGGDELGDCVTSDPEPGGCGRGVNLQTPFVELHMRQMQ